MKANIGLIGFGNVGQGFYELVGERYADALTIERIVVRDRDKPRPIEGPFGYDVSLLLDDPSIDVIVEAIDDADDAFAIVSAALRLGKRVVTANKKLVAESLPELLRLERKYGGRLLYEASVCANIPIIRTLESYYRRLPVRSVEGIVNGSSNYILSRITRDGLDYASALALAQELGFSESDPTLDVGGFDARSKLAILSRHAFGEYLAPTEILTAGIANVTPRDVKLAAEHGCRIKLVASAVRTEQGLRATVAPRFVEKGHDLYDVEDEENALAIETVFGHRQRYLGKGAGARPTGEAVLADVLTALDGYSYTAPLVRATDAKRQDHPRRADRRTIYARTNDPQLLDLLSLDGSIVERRADGEGIVIGTIDRSLLTDLTKIQDGSLFIAEVPERVVQGVREGGVVA